MRSQSFFVQAFFLAISLIGVRVNAFPDTFRHGYVNCSTCHVSPAGGGLLNGYGRSLSRELMSSWGYKNEEQPLHGAIAIPDKLNERFAVGGDARYLSRRRHTPAMDVDEGFLMQAQVRGALMFEKFKFLMAVGSIENPRKSQTVVLNSPEYYGLWTPKEEVHFRLGRFQPIYGLRLPDHNLWIRSETGFAPWLERDTAEFILETEATTVSLAGFQSTSAVDPSQQATGYTGSIFQTIGEKTRIGASALNSEGQGVRMKVLSLHAAIPFTDRIYGLSEFSRVWQLDSMNDIGLVRLGYEIFKGFTILGQGQSKNVKSTTTDFQSRTGGGFIWLPRPHFELMGIFETLQSSKGSSTENYLMLHYYL